MNVLTKTQATEKLLSVLPNDIQKLSKLFTEDGVDLFLVGGCVRDAFLGKNPKDFDVATNAMPERIMNILRKAHITCQLQGEAFGVVVARMSEDIEIATFRVDLNNTDDRNTDVKLGVTIEEDVQRRDLTINALFMNLDTNEIIDLVGGIDDLNNGIIRTVGTPSMRFSEDNLRKLRAIVRSVKTGFNFDINTFESIKNDPKLNVSKERIIMELFKVDSNFESLNFLLLSSNLIFEILPDLNISACNQKIHSLDFMFALILQKEDLLTLNKKLIDLKFPNSLANNICFLIKLMNTDLTLVNPFNFFKDRQKTQITDKNLLLAFNNDKNINELIKFKLDTELSQNLINDGFTGKELGKAIEHFYFINRTNILK